MNAKRWRRFRRWWRRNRRFVLAGYESVFTLDGEETYRRMVQLYREEAKRR